MDERKVALAARLMRDRDVPVSEVCGAVGVSRATLCRYLNPDGTPREKRTAKSPAPHIAEGRRMAYFPHLSTYDRPGLACYRSQLRITRLSLRFY